MAANIDPTLKGPFIFLFRGGGIPVPFPLLLPPQHVKTAMVSRGAVHQTLADQFLDEFSGPRSTLVTVTIRGTYGYNRVGLGSLMHLAFEKLYEVYNGLTRETKARLKARQEFIALSRLYFWRIWIQRFEWEISREDPLLYYYSITLVRLQDYLSLTDPQLPESTAPADATGLRALF